MKKILVIGATSEIALDFITKNANKYEFYLAARTIEKIASFPNVFCVDFDSFHEDSFEHLPKLDGVVYCAGITNHLPVKFIKKKHYESVFNANFFGAVMSISTLLNKNKIEKGASLVFLSSIATHFPYFGGALYVSSKLALEGYVKNLALELSSKKIRANCVSPAFVKGKMANSINNFTDEATIEKFVQKHPYGIIDKENVTSVIDFLLNDTNNAVTGQIIQVGNFNTGLNT